MSTRITLSTPCYTIDGGTIITGTLADHADLIETTTRPTGVGPKYYTTTVARTIEATEDDDGNIIEPERTEDVWCVAKWATWGGPERIVSEHASEAEAEQACEDIHIMEIMGSHKRCVYLDREQAEQALADMMDAAE